METHTEVTLHRNSVVKIIKHLNGNTEECTINRYGVHIKRLINKDPKHPNSWRSILDATDNIIGHLQSDNPFHPDSFRWLFDSDGENTKNIGILWSENPKHPFSYRYLFNERGERIGKLYSENPEHAMSWVYVHDQDGKITHIKYGGGNMVAC